MPASEKARVKGAPIKEIILENFMSYEYARIPLKEGLNIICGPNGSGKSSVLLAIAVALGQAYTERSRKLSGLIRRGREIARVSLVFDNNLQDGQRPIPSSRSDTFMLSRYMKQDGSYWCEADYKSVSKYEVERILREMGINPDNMLILMHQNMVEQLGIITPQEKLRLVEEAVGFEEYRARVLEARERLSRLAGEEASVAQLMGSAEETLGYWKEVYEKYLQRKDLLARKAHLEREAVWCQVGRQERALDILKERLEGRRTLLANTLARIAMASEKLKELQGLLDGRRLEERKGYYALLELEKEKAGIETVAGLVGRFPVLEAEAKAGEARRGELAGRIEEVQSTLGVLERELNSLLENYVAQRVEGEVQEYHRRVLEEEIRGLEGEVREAERRLAAFGPAMEGAGERIETERTLAQIREEAAMTQAKIEALGEIPEEAERVYTDYANLYTELKAKMDLLAENRKKVLGELEERNKVWRKVMEDLLEEVNPAYQEIMAEVGASGMVRLVDAEDVETAGLELLVGFRGAPPIALDAYTQSGGERSASAMAFLLALQRHVVSPFRAVDEFDIHMDSRNREVVFQMIVNTVKRSGVQYILITPRQITVPDQGVHVIVVQNAYGRSQAAAVG